MEVYEKGRKSAITIMVIGGIIFFMGLVGLGWFSFEKTEYIKYGGDAYTGIQNASADTANNIAKACGILCAVLGFLALSSGAMLLNYFNIKKFESSEANRRHNEILLALKGNSDNGITSIEEKYICSICDNPIAYGQKKCDHCGSKIDWAKE